MSIAGWPKSRRALTTFSWYGQRNILAQGSHTKKPQRADGAAATRDALRAFHATPHSSLAPGRFQSRPPPPCSFLALLEPQSFQTRLMYVYVHEHVHVHVDVPEFNLLSQLTSLSWSVWFEVNYVDLSLTFKLFESFHNSCLELLPK